MFTRTTLLYRWVILFLSVPYSASLVLAQGYTAADSAAVWALLDRADAEDLAGNLTKAEATTQEALRISTQKKIRRGEGFACLKLADLELKKEGGSKLQPLFEKAFLIGAQLRDSMLLGLAHHQQGQYYRDQASYPEALRSFAAALPCYAARKELHYMAVVNNDRGFIFERQGAYDSATRMYLEAIRLFEAEKDVKEAANTTGNLGIVQYRTGNKEEAIRLFRQSAAMRETIGDAKGLAAVYGNLVTAFSSLGRLDSAYHYQQLAVSNAEKTGVKNILAQSLTNQAVLLTRRQEYQQALVIEERAVSLYREMGDQLKVGNRYLSMAVISDKLKDSVAAENYFRQASALAAQLQNKPLFQNMYSARSAFYAGRNNFVAAMEDYKKYVLYKDSLLNEKVAANRNELEVKYESEKKDFEITRLKTEQQIRQLELEKQQALAAGNQLEAKRKQDQIILLRQQEQLKSLQLEQQRQELEKQQLLAKESEQQMLQSLQNLQIAENEKKLRQRQLERERLIRNGVIGFALAMLLIGGLLFNRYQLRKKLEEQQHLLDVRNRISKDLHDDIGSTLTSIHILSSVSRETVEQDPVQAKQMLGDIAAQSKSIQQNMSDIVWAIRPDNDKVENLVSRMREYIGQTLEPQKIDTHLDADESLLSHSLPMEHRKELLLIFKEAVNNITKHAGARNVRISLKNQTPGFLTLSVSDNGCWKGKSHITGTGTYSMQQRAAAIGAALTIEGSAQGTEVLLKLPIP